MHHCLVTGGAGFIGSHIVEGALAKGWKVRVLDNLSTGKIENLSGVRDKIEFFEGDVRDEARVKEAVEGVDLVFHLAALVSVPISMEDPGLSATINDLGTLNVFTAAADAGVGRVVYSSSSAVYGDHNVPPHREAANPDPASPYAAHKWLGEHYAEVLQKTRGLDVVSLRYFNVFGPRQDPGSPYSGVISIFIDRLCADRGVTIFGDGEQTRDFVFVSDVANANLLAATCGLGEERVFNIGTGESVSINKLYSTLAGLCGKGAAPTHAPPRTGDVMHSCAVVERAEKILGFSAEVPLEEGLQKTVEWAAG